MYKGSYTPAVRSNPVTPVSPQPKATTTVAEPSSAEKKKPASKPKAKKKGKAAGKSKAKPAAKAKPEHKAKTKTKDIPAFIAGLPGNPEVKNVRLDEIDLENTQFQLRASIRVGDLAANIKRHGQKIPVLLKGQKAPYQIIGGFRRINAIKKIGWDRVSAIILPRISEEEALKLAILENVLRKTYGDLDKALAVQRFKEMGKTVKEIAEDVFHLKKRQIQYLHKLLTFDKTLQDAMSEGKITTKHAITLQEAKNRVGGLELKSWIKRIVEDELSYRKLKKALRKECGAKTGNGKPVELFREIKGDSGDISLRFWPVKLDPKAMTKEEAGRMKTMLERALELVKGVL